MPFFKVASKIEHLLNINDSEMQKEGINSLIIRYIGRHHGCVECLQTVFMKLIVLIYMPIKFEVRITWNEIFRSCRINEVDVSWYLSRL
jgi:hypothetical protein